MVVGVVVDDRIFFFGVGRLHHRFSSPIRHRQLSSMFDKIGVRNEFVGRFILKSVGVKHDKFTMYYIYKCVFQCIHVCK